MLVPYLLKVGVNTIESGGPWRRTAYCAAGIVVTALLQGIVRTFSRFVIFNAGRDVEYDLRNDLFAHLLKLPQSYYLEQQTGDLMSRLVNDVGAIRMLLGPGILNVLNTPVYYAYAISIMVSMDPLLTAVALSPYPVLLWVVKRYSRQLMERSVRVQAGLADMSSRVQEAVSGIPIVKAYVRAAAEEEKFARINAAFTEEALRLARVRARMFPSMQSAAGLGTLAVLAYGGAHVISGRLSVGDLVAFIAYLNMLAWPTMALGWMISIVQRGRAAMQRLEQVFAVRPSITDPPHPKAIGAVRGAVEFRDVEFAYPTRRDGQPALRGVSLRISAGKKLAIVGRTGAGKSTLVQLLPRLFDATGGAILIDGHDVRELSLADLRRAIAVVPQDPFLFSATIRENIAFGVDVVDPARLHQVAEAAGIAAEIGALPAGYDTVVGERGVLLSGGQRQRLTLARALYRDAPILVLDDALSSVDARTEERILAQLRALSGSRTWIVVAHRLSAVQDADWIVVLDDGRVVEEGDHASLLARDGIYAELFRRQRLEEEIAEL